MMKQIILHLPLFILFLLFHSPYQVSGAEAEPTPTPVTKQTKLKASNELPLEFQFLIESLQTYELNSQEKKTFQDLIKSLDQYLKLAPPKHLFFIIKSEIYKGILNTQWQDSSNSIKMDQKSIQLLNEKLLQNFSAYHSFAKWLIESIQSDLWELSSLDNQSAQSPGSKVKVRTRILFPWFDLIMHNDAKNFNHKIRPILFAILKKIHFSVYLLGRFTHLKKTELPPLKGDYYFFEAKEITEVESLSTIEKDDFAHYQKLKKLEAEKIMKNLSLPVEESPAELSPPPSRPSSEWVPKD